jgi:hypothetical protein
MAHGTLRKNESSFIVHIRSQTERVLSDVDKGYTLTSAVDKGWVRMRHFFQVSCDFISVFALNLASWDALRYKRKLGSQDMVAVV